MFLDLLKFSSSFFFFYLSLMWPHLIEMFLEGRNRKQIPQPVHALTHTCCFWLGLKQNCTCFVTRAKEILSKQSSHSLLTFLLLALCILIFYCCIFKIAWRWLFLFPSQNMFYKYISIHMSLVNHSHMQCLQYSLSNGCWLKKTL